MGVRMYVCMYAHQPVLPCCVSHSKKKAKKTVTSSLRNNDCADKQTDNSNAVAPSLCWLSKAILYIHVTPSPLLAYFLGGLFIFSHIFFFAKFYSLHMNVLTYIQVVLFVAQICSH